MRVRWKRLRGVVDVVEKEQRWSCRYVGFADHLVAQVELLLPPSRPVYVNLRRYSKFRWKKPKLQPPPMGALPQNVAPPCHLNTDQSVVVAAVTDGLHRHSSVRS